MRTKLIFYSFLLVTINSFSQSFEWAYESSAHEDESSGTASIITDGEGNIYVTGSFTGTTDFNSGTTTNAITSIGSSGNGYILKLDKYKNFVWVRQIKSEGSSSGWSIILDHDNNLIITAVVTGSNIDLDPTEDGEDIVSNSEGSLSSVLIKIDIDGNYIFGKIFLGRYTRQSTVDLDNNIFISGTINNPDTIMVSKYTSSGALLWEEEFNSSGHLHIYSLTTDSENNVILYGNMNNNIQFFGTNYTNIFQSSFMFKLTGDGEQIWFKKLHITNQTTLKDKSILTDADNNIYFTENYGDSSPIDFGNMMVALPYIWGRESAVIKLNPNGDYIWGCSIYGDEVREVNSIAIDNEGEVLAVGYATGTAYAGNTSNQIYNTGGSLSGFLVRLDSSGNFITSRNIPDSPYYSIDTDNEDSILIGGTYNGLKDFDPSVAGIYNMQSFHYNMFVLKLNICTSEAPTANQTQSFCSGNNPTIASLQPNTPSTKWFSSSSAANQLSATTPLTNGTTYYAAQQTGSCPESARTPVTVTVIPAPAMPVLPAQAFCESQAATLASINTSGQTLNWYSTATDLTPLPATTLLASTTYYAAQVTSGCESARVAVAVSINSVALPVAPAVQTFCIQQNATTSVLTATGQNLQWYDAATGGNLIAPTTIFTTSTTLYLTQTVNGCESNRISVDLIINQTATPTGNATQTFCIAANAVAGNLIIAGTGIILYDAVTAGSVIPANTPLVNGVTYYASQTLNGCESVSRIAVTVSIATALPATDYSVEVCDEGNDGSEAINLADYNQYLSAPATGLTYNYYQNLTAAQNSDSAYEVTPDYMLQGNKTIYVQITSVNGCSSIAVLSLSLLQTPDIQIPDVLELCNEPIQVTPGGMFDGYLWPDGSTATSLEITQPGNYWFTGTINGTTIDCSITKNFQVISASQPSISSIEVNELANSNNTLIVHTTSLGNYQYSLDNISYQDSNVFYNIKPGNYIVYVKNDCAVAVKTITLLGFPTYFTPNGDGDNDSWYVHYASKNESLSTFIYDRYGKLITNLKPGESWDGTYNGHNLPATDYWFTAIQNSNGYTHKGHFSLIR